MEFIKRFQRHAEEIPDKIALHDCNDERNLSYADLDLISGRVYHYLKDRGIGKEDFVNILLPRSLDPIVAMLGVMKAGAAFVVLEEDYPEERVSFIQKDCGCKLIIDSKAWQEIMAYEPLTGYEATDDHDAAFAFYTSGSTGTPKGVLHEYGNIDRLALSYYENGTSLVANTSFGLTAPLYFIASIVFVVNILDCGSTLNVVPYDIAKNPAAAKACFVKHNINAMFCAPSAYRLYCQIPSLKLIVVASEPAKRIWSGDPDLTVLNCYSMSEAAFLISYARLDKECDIAPIGQPAFDLNLTLMDENGHIVPDGETGEICVENPFFRGYINNPEETSSAFKDGFFHTNDLAKRLPDGNYVITGRKDDMIKISGNRIEPAEIEAVIKRVSELDQVIVKGFGEGDHAYICMYYADNADLDEEKLRLALSTHLPYYMIPSHYVHLDALPITASGKLSRSLLPEPVLSNSTRYSKPTNGTERALCEAMTLVLGMEQIGAEDDFYQLGGSSISSMEVVGKCELPGLSINQIFRGRTPRRIAEIYLSEQSPDSHNSIPEADTADLSRPCPLSQAQLGIFLECERREGEAVYNNPLLLRLAQNVDTASLKNAVEAAIRAHKGLFAQIIMDETGNPSMKYNSDYEKQEICEEKQTTWESLINERGSLVQPFFIKNERLFRITLFETGEDKYLFMDFHHIIFDGTSMQILFNDIENALRGRFPEKESWSAFDASAFEHNQRSGEALRLAKDWNLSHFGEIENVSLPEGDLSGKDYLFGDKTITLNLSADELRSYCLIHKTTENVFAISAFGYLLSAYTMQEKPAFSTIYNGRKDPRTARTVSMFVTTLPVLCSIEKNCSVRQYLSDVKEQLLGSMANDLYSFAELASDTGISSEVQFVWQGDVLTLPNNETLQVVREDLPYAATGETLSVELVPRENQLLFHVQYNANLYSESFVTLFAESFENVLRSMMNAKSISEVSLLSDSQIEDIMAISKGEILEYDRSQTWIDMFQSCARRSPDKRAVVDSLSSYTYAELDMASDIIATYLIKNGVQDNSFVAVKMGRVKEFLAAVIGIHKAGAAYVPVDPDYPIDRIEYMLEDSEAKVVLTRELVNEILSGNTSPEPVNHATPSHRAYMIYTSGSTGKPKGVIIPHSALRALVGYMGAVCSYDSDSKNLCHPSFSFDGSVMDLYPTLSHGGEVHLTDEEIRKDTEKIHEYICQHRINGMALSTQIGMLLVNQYPEMDMRYVMMGGEKMLPCSKTNIRLINSYGPTEFTVGSSYHVVDQEKDSDDIPIGRPVPNTYSFICDRFGNLLPQGIAGELCLMGPQIAEGYWKRPELTSEKFTYCSFKPGERMYRTGDLACYNKEGELEFLGRIDTQVKLRGFRIELGEIESLASRFEGIINVAAEVRKEQLVLYYTCDTEEGIDENALRQFLSNELTSYMVPSVYMRLESMPMTPNGKIDRKTLPEPQVQGSAEYVEPSGEAELAVADAMKQVLGMENAPGALDDFFSLGGDSIRAIRLVAILREKSLQVSVADIMKHKTVRGIAGSLENTNESDISQEPYEGEVPDSAIVSFFKYLELPKPHHFNQTRLLKLTGPTQKDALLSAWNALVYQHDMLRAVMREGSLYVRGPETTIEIEEYTAGDDSEISSLCEKIQAHLDMEKALVRTALIHGISGDYFYIAIHHLVVDGVSWRIILSDLENACRQALVGKEIKLPAKTNTYSNYAETLQKYRDSYALSMEITYWERVQKKLTNLCTPDEKDYGREFETVCRTMDPEDTSRFLHTGFDKAGADINDALLTAVCESFRIMAGHDSISLQFEGHGREDIGEKLSTDRTIGWFTSAYPVVVENISGDTGRDLLLAKEALHRIPGKGVGYNVLKFISGQNPASIEKNITPQIGFNYLGDMSVEKASDDAIFTDTDIATGDDFAKENTFGPDITINCFIRDNSFYIYTGYNKGKYTHKQISGFTDDVLAKMLAVAEYLASDVNIPATASDLGETEWSMEEFENVSAEFSSRGETIERIYPLLPMQEGMLLKHVSEPESPAYRLVSIYEMDVVPTEDAMIRALDRLGDQYEVLRTAIIHEGVSHPRQAIVNRKLGLEVIDISSEPDPEKAVYQLRENILRNGFDFQKKPLFNLICAKSSDKHCYLIVSVHHIIVDGWCIALYMGSLEQYLREEMKGIHISVEKPSTTGKYEAAVREILKKDMYAGLDYWKDLLKGYETKAHIPSYDDIPETVQHTEGHSKITICSETTDKLEKLCRGLGATINNSVELAWGMVLATYSRLEDVVFAKVVSGRDNTSIDTGDVVGLFINSIPVRIRMNKNTTVREALKNLQEQTAESNTYDFCPLSQIQQVTSLGSDLFQTVLAFENYNSGNEVHTSDALLKPLLIKEEIFDEISPAALIQNGELTLYLDYDVNLYREAEIRRVLSLFKTFIEQMAEKPESTLSSLNRLDSSDIQEIVDLSKGETLEYDRSKTWLDLFMDSVKKNPAKPAVVDNTGSYTYSELVMASDIIAAYLSEHEIKENSFVAIRMGRVKEFMAAVMGVHKAGAAYVPIDLDYPEDRVNYMLSDSGATILLTEEKIAEIFTSQGSNHLSGNKSQDDSAACPLKKCSPEHLAYMIYTSGSTGKPKGVMIQHKALLNFVHFIRKRWELNDQSRIALHSNFAFDAAVEDLYPALTTGGTVYIVPESARRDTAEMKQFIKKHSINGGCYSTQFGQLLAGDEPLDVDYICVGGEAMTSSLNARGHVYNTYGPTEFTVDSTYYELEKGRHYKNIPIGRPLYNCFAYIIDSYGNLLPQGIVGELCMAGPQMALGYHNRPELTQKSITEICLYGDTRVKLYHTGDLARYNEEKQLEYSGRIDTQVKLRGFRIELGEIETKASQYAGIRLAAAEVRNNQLVLYYNSSETIDESALKVFLSKSLAEYMVPTLYMRLESMPMTPNGKINRKALPTPDFSALKVDFVAPETELEQKLCTAFAEVLGMKEGSIGINDDFFDLGGSSIQCMRLISTLKMQISTADIYKYRTVARIARRLSEISDDIPESQARKMLIPATAGQINMMDYQFLSAKSVMYNLPALYRLADTLTDEQIENAIYLAVKNHPALASIFEPDEDGNMVQRYWPGLLEPAHFEDIPEEELHDTIDNLVQPFTDFRKPLFRLRLLRCGNLRYMFMDMHHMISDGFSIGVLMEDFARATRGEELPEDCYYSYLLSENKAKDTEEFAAAKKHFDTLLGDTDWCNIPTPDFESWSPDVSEEHLSLGLTMQEMEAAQKRFNASANVICLAAGALAMQEYSGRTDVLINWINENRSQVKYSNTVGLLFKILPVALHMDEYPTAVELISEIKHQTEEGFANSICDYMEIMENALMDSIEINYLPALDNDDQSDKSALLKEIEIAYQHTATSGRVGMYITEIDSVLFVFCAYQKRLYAPGSMASFLKLFKKHLQSIVLERTPV